MADCYENTDERLAKFQGMIDTAAENGKDVAQLQAALDAYKAALTATRPQYEALGRGAAARLGEAAPQGSTFLFIDVGPALDGRGLAGFLEDCAAQGLFVAPGPSFGPYPTHVRICYTAAAPEVVTRGVQLLARLLGR